MKENTQHLLLLNKNTCNTINLVENKHILKVKNETDAQLGGEGEASRNLTGTVIRKKDFSIVSNSSD